MIPNYDAWKLSGPPEGPVPCDHCKELFSEDDIDVLDAGQFCKDCTPCDSCGENVGEAQFADKHDLCKDCYVDLAEAQEQDRYEAFHGSDQPQTLDEKFAAARQLDADLKAGRA